MKFLWGSTVHALTENVRLFLEEWYEYTVRDEKISEDSRRIRVDAYREFRKFYHAVFRVWL